MVSQKNTVLRSDPLYKELMIGFQRGKWEDCQGLIKELRKQYPVDPELERLAENIALRESIEQREAGQRAANRAETKRRWLRISVALLISLTLLIAGYSSLAASINDRLSLLRDQITLSSKLRDSQNLIEAGRPFEAKLLLDEIALLRPDFPGLVEAQDRVAVLIGLENLYDEAKGLLASGKYSDALAVLEKIKSIETNYRDVDVLINDISLKENLADEFAAEAERHYAEQQWAEAITDYEQAALTFPGIADDEFNENLITCYAAAAMDILHSEKTLSFEELDQAQHFVNQAVLLKQKYPTLSAARGVSEEELNALLVAGYRSSAEALILAEADATDNIDLAITLLGRALLIAPEDENLRVSYDEAKAFLAALDYFSKESWAKAIETILPVYTASEDYANGTARQLLFEAYYQQAQRLLEIGEIDAALLNYESAEFVVEAVPGLTLQRFAVSVGIADALGALGRFREASARYQSAVLFAKLKQNPETQETAGMLAIYNAEIAAYGSYHELAYSYYSDAMEDPALYVTVEYILQPGDYALQIAREFLSTTWLIGRFNEESGWPNARTGTHLVIPTLE